MTEQLTLGLALRDGGMAQAAAAQERASPGWQDRAISEIRRIALRQGTVFTDDLRAFLESDPAPHYNALGALWSRAMRVGLIVPTDRTRRSRDPKKHAHNYPVYQSSIYRSAA